MIPVLFAKDATEFVSNGLGFMADATKAQITEERNGIYELEMQYPLTGARYGSIENGCIIKAKVSDETGSDALQLFRIYNISRPLNGIVTIKAAHISYDLNGCQLKQLVTSGTAMQALGVALTGTDFTAYSDIETLNNVNIKDPCSVRAVLGGMQGSLLDVYGGEYEFDNFTVRLWQSRGSNRDVTVEYGKNLTSLTQDNSIESAWTHVMPFAKYDTTDEYGNNTTVYVYIEGDRIAVPNAPALGYERTMLVDLSSKFGENTRPTPETLLTAAQSYVAGHTFGPSVNLKISFVQLWQTEEYKDIAPLERVKLCDTVTVKFPALGVTSTAKVIKTVYDCIAEKYVSMELGNPKSSLADTVLEQSAEIKDVAKDIDAKISASTAAWHKAIDDATDLITGADGGHVRIMQNENGLPTEILIMDQPDVADAVKLWRWNLGGLGYSSDGYDGPYGTAITMDGQIVADYITTGTLTANLIRAGTIQDVNAINLWNLETGDFRFKNDLFQFDSTGSVWYKVTSGTQHPLTKMDATGTTYYDGEGAMSDLTDPDSLHVVGHIGVESIDWLQIAKTPWGADDTKRTDKVKIDPTGLCVYGSTTMQYYIQSAEPVAADVVKQAVMPRLKLDDDGVVIYTNQPPGEYRFWTGSEAEPIVTMKIGLSEGATGSIDFYKLNTVKQIGRYDVVDSSDKIATLEYGEIDTPLATLYGAGLHSIGQSFVGLFGGSSDYDNRDHHIAITNGAVHIISTEIHIGDKYGSIFNTPATSVTIGGSAVTIGSPTTITGALTLRAGLSVATNSVISGTLTVSDVIATSASISSMTGNVSMSNNLTVGGTLGVTGNATFNGGLTVGTAVADNVFPTNSGQLWLGISSNMLLLNDSRTNYNTMAGTLDMANNQIINANMGGGSDARLKTHIKPATTDALKALTGADLKSFDWLSDNRHVDVGLIAQQLREVAPGLVIEDKLGRLSIDMMGLVGYCVKAIQQLAERTGYDAAKTEWKDPFTMAQKRAFIKKTGGSIANG